MTLFDIIRNLQAIAAQEPSVKSVSDGDIYDCLNAAVDIKYGVFHITQDTHTTNGDLDVWGLNLFYIDRLLDNGENRLSIQSAGITILENVLKRFADTFGAEYLNNIVYSPFTQRFKDNCAGVFCKISISTVMDNLCEEGGKIVLVKNQDKSIDITSNGRYNVTPDYGFSGLGQVDINVDVQGGGCVASEESKTYTANGTYTITPTSGDCISKATVTVNVPSEEPTLQSKTIDIAENGSYSLAPDAGVDGLSNVGINVNVPTTATTAYVVPDDMRFQYSTFSTFPAEGLDFSQKTNFQSCWESCSVLTEFPLIDTSNGTNFMETWYACYRLKSFPALDFSKGETFKCAWQDCSSLTEFPLIDTAKGTNFNQAWSNCRTLTEFPAINTSNGTNFNRAWAYCSSLKSFPQLDLSKGTNFEYCWYGCSELTSFPVVDFSNGETFKCAWYGCSKLVTFPALNLSKGTDFQEAWDGCKSLTSFPQMDLSSGTNFYEAWAYCSSLTSFPQMDLSSGTNFKDAWYNCSSLTEFPMLDLSNGTDFQEAWYGCSKLVTFPALNLSKGTNFAQAWDGCKSLTSFPQMDLSSGTNFNWAWYGCKSLKEFPLLDLSAGTDFSMAWNFCSSLTSFPQMDLSKGTNFEGAWGGCSNLTNLGGFGAIKESIELPHSPNLTVDSLMNVINQAADLNILGITGKTMTFGSTNLAKLTDAQKAVATSKGWTLA